MNMKALKISAALATLLVDGGSAASRFVLRKGAVLALESTERIPGKPGRWRLRWHFSPELLTSGPLHP